MITNMHVIPWDVKALRQEVDRIIRSFLKKEKAIEPLKTEKIMPNMHVIPWDMKALRNEVNRIVDGFSRSRMTVSLEF